MAQVLRVADITSSGEPEKVHARPWSKVFRLTTDRGHVFLKVTGPSQAHEAAITRILSPNAADLIPEVLGLETDKGWLLLKDAGDPLNKRFVGSALVEAWIAFLPRYAELQRAYLGHEDALLATGLPDRRLDRLPESLAAIVDDATILAPLASDPHAMSRNELLVLLPQLRRLCDDLAAYGIGPTVQHDDLQDANVFTKSAGRVALLDWGDACLTHPFLSLWTMERAAGLRLGQGHRSVIEKLREAYLEPWSSLVPMRALRSAARIGAELGAVTRALCWYRTATLNVDTLA